MGILQVVYEDGHMACVVKPAGMPTAQVSSIRNTDCKLTCIIPACIAVTLSIRSRQCKLLFLRHTYIIYIQACIQKYAHIYMQGQCNCYKLLFILQLLEPGYVMQPTIKQLNVSTAALPSVCDLFVSMSATITPSKHLLALSACAEMSCCYRVGQVAEWIYGNACPTACSPLKSRACYADLNMYAYFFMPTPQACCLSSPPPVNPAACVCHRDALHVPL